MNVGETTSNFERQYWCFISYRHSDNKEEGRQWASWLHHELETYEVPFELVGTKNLRGETIPSRIFPVFRDEAELGAGSLSQRINNALSNSKTLVVICSPRVLESDYVSEEIRYFKGLGRADRIFATVIDGVPESRIVGQGKCFPDELSNDLNLESEADLASPKDRLAADFRLGDGTQGWTTPAAYEQALKRLGTEPSAVVGLKVKAYSAKLRMGKLSVLSGVLGVPLGVLEKRDHVYQLRRARVRTRIITGVLAVISVFAALAGWQAHVATTQKSRAEFQTVLATRSQHEAETNLALAEKKEKEATQNQELAEQNQRLAEKNQDLAEQNQKSAEEQRNIAQLNEANAWLLQAENAKNIYPNSSLYAARAIGFTGLGKETQSEDFRISFPDLLDSKSRDLRDKALRIANSSLYPIWASSPASIQPNLTAIGACWEDRIIITGSGTGTLRYWNADTGELIREIDAHSDEILKILVIPDLDLLITGSADRSLRIGKLSSGEMVRRRTFDDIVSSLAYLRNGGKIVAGDYRGSLTLLSPSSDATGDLEFRNCERNALGSIADVAVTSDERYLAICFSESYDANLPSDEQVEIWDLGRLELYKTIEIGGESGKDVEFSPDDKILSVASFDGGIRCWKVPAFERMEINHRSSRTYSSQFYVGDRLLMTAGIKGDLFIWDFENDEPVATVPCHGAVMIGMCMDPERGVVYAADRSGKISITQTVVPFRSFSSEGHSDEMEVLEFREDPVSFVSFARDNLFAIWESDPNRGFRVSSYRNLKSTSNLKPIISNGADLMCYINERNGVSVLDWSGSKNEPLDYQIIEDPGEIEQLAVSQDFHFVACSVVTDETSGGDTKFIMVWDRVTRRRIAKILLRTEIESDYLAFIGNDKLVYVEDDESFEIVTIMGGESENILLESKMSVNEMRVSHDGTKIAFAAGNEVLVWDVNERRFNSSLRGHNGPINSLAFAETDRKLISGDSDGRIGIWNIETNTLEGFLSGHQGNVTSLAIDERSNRILTGGADRRIILWESVNRALEDFQTVHQEALVSEIVFGDEDEIVSAASNGNWCVSEFPALIPISKVGSNSPLHAFTANLTSEISVVIPKGSNTIDVYEVRSGRKICTMPSHSNPVRQITVSRKSPQLLASASGSEIIIWDALSGQIYFTVDADQVGMWGGFYQSLTFVGKTDLLAYTEFNIGGLPVVRVIDGRTGRAVGHIRCPDQGEPYFVTSASGENRIACISDFDNSTGGNSVIEVWDLDTWKKLFSVQTESVNRVALSSDGSVLASGFNMLKVWNVAEGKVIREFFPKDGRVTDMELHARGEYLLNGDYHGNLSLWNLHRPPPNLASLIERGWYSFNESGVVVNASNTVRFPVVSGKSNVISDGKLYRSSSERITDASRVR